jgi:hypothetical protein
MILARSILAAVVAASAALAAGAVRGRHTPPGAHIAAPRCGTAEHHQFDFFEGDWDVYDFGVPDSVIARNKVTSMLGGCAVREVYVQRDGLEGESFSAFDAARQLWHQSWITNHGSILLLEGRLEGERMVLIATERDKKGDSSLVRGIWVPQRGSVRETAERSKDGGRTWEPLFDIVFRKHKAAGGA